VRNLAIGMNLLIVLLVLGSCGPNARDKALHSVFVSVNAARDGFLAYDLKHQQDLIDASPTPEAKEAVITAYRVTQAHIVELFDAAYRAIAAAAILKDGHSMPEVITAAALLKQALEDLTAKPAPAKPVAP